MKNRRVSLSIAILVACLGIVTVSLSDSLRPKATSGANLTPTAAANKKPTVATFERPQPETGHFLMALLDLERLTNDADLIFIGRVNSTRARPPITTLVEAPGVVAQPMIASLSIDRLVKGVISAQTVDAEFVLVNVPSRYTRIEPTQFGIFFLKKNAQGTYGVLDPTYPYVVAPSNPTVSVERGLDLVVDLVGQVLLGATSIEDRRLAVKTLSSARTEKATGLLRQGAKDRDAVVRMQSISALLNRDDVATLEAAETILLNPPADTEQYLLDNVSAALEGVRNPRAIPILQRLLKSSDSHTRLSVVAALRQMHISNAIEGLVIALSDENRDVRYEGVIGLAELTNQSEWGPAIDTFQKDEQRYLDHWKEWARNKRPL
jgi:hypothetical protein